jgi:hypothetical protein
MEVARPIIRQRRRECIPLPFIWNNRHHSLNDSFADVVAKVSITSSRQQVVLPSPLLVCTSLVEYNTKEKSLYHPFVYEKKSLVFLRATKQGESQVQDAFEI